jgi:hypothetical protein
MYHVERGGAPCGCEMGEHDGLLRVIRHRLAPVDWLRALDATDAALHARARLLIAPIQNGVREGVARQGVARGGTPRGIPRPSSWPAASIAAARPSAHAASFASSSGVRLVNCSREGGRDGALPRGRSRCCHRHHTPSRCSTRRGGCCMACLRVPGAVEGGRRWRRHVYHHALWHVRLRASQSLRRRRPCATKVRARTARPLRPCRRRPRRRGARGAARGEERTR